MRKTDLAKMLRI